MRSVYMNLQISLGLTLFSKCVECLFPHQSCQTKIQFVLNLIYFKLSEHLIDLLQFNSTYIFC